MNIPEKYFKSPEDVIRWHQDKVPGSCERYLEIIKDVRTSGFPGSVKLLTYIANGKDVTNFASYVSEMNLAKILLDQKVVNLRYEPKDIPDVDFVFEDIAMSVKNLHPKIYEKNEQGWIEEMQMKGGGETTFAHKNFSSTSISVKKTEMGTFGWERTEIGHSGFLDSDLYEMSSPLHHMGEFEQIDVGDRKKVLFFFIQSGEFAHYYIADIVGWYFGLREYQNFIFQYNMQWYLKLLNQQEKNNSIDALVFMYAPDSILSWPSGCMGDTRDGKARLIIYTREKSLFERLKNLLKN